MNRDRGKERGREKEDRSEEKVENRIIVQRRPRCRLGADEKEEMKWTVRLTGIYILSCAICVSELCRVTVRRIRSGKSVIITRATLAEASSATPSLTFSPRSFHPPWCILFPGPSCASYSPHKSGVLITYTSNQIFMGSFKKSLNYTGVEKSEIVIIIQNLLVFVLFIFV